MEFQGLLVYLAPEVLLVLMAAMEHRVIVEVQANQGHLAPLVRQEFLVNQALKVNLVLVDMVLEELKEAQDLMDFLVFLVLQGLMEPLD
jgi:hypothetical protein